MTYQRVIPRDLFNEASLLKCYGQLYLQLEFHNFPGVELVHIRNAFDVRQDQRSGAIYIDNIRLSARGVLYGFWRPRNSRAPYPLYLNAGDDDIAVFNDDGTFTAEMLDFLRG
jgi:hypothetical protein